MKVKRGEQVFSSQKFRRIASTVRQRKLKRKAMRKKGKKKNEIIEQVKVTKPVQTRKSKKKRMKDQKNKAAEARKQQLMQGARDDDRIIKEMEKKLGLKKRKKKSLPASFQRDGLDYLLDVVEGRLNDDKTTDLNTILKEDESDDEVDENDVSQMEMEENDLGEDVKMNEDTDEDESGDDEDESREHNGIIDDMAEEKSDDDTSSAAEDGNISEKGDEVGDEDDSQDNNDEDESDYDSSFIDDSELINDDDAVSEEADEEPAEEEETGDEEAAVVSGSKRRLDSESFEESKAGTDGKKKPAKKLDSDSEGDSKSKDSDANYKEAVENGVWEDIYGRKRDKEGNVIQEEKQKYVPPGKRDSKTSESLKRQIKGHLNRLSEANMHATVSQVEKLYSSHTRHDVNDTLTQLILEAVCQSTITPERLVMEHAVLVAALHGKVGTECGAHILHKVVAAFHEMYKDPTIEKQGKRIHNTIVLLSHLYTFKVCNSSLIYDVLNLLGENDELSSVSVELILLVLRSVGFLLRKDDSLKLKDLVIFLQEKAAKQHKKEQDSRVSWMLETLLAVRNNNMRKIPQYDPSTAEQLRKVLNAETRRGTPLAVTLDDLLQAEARGRWWVVGSSWSGKSETVVNREVDDDKLLNLAKKQRMSTDVRKRIFCAIMGAEDYMDAMERLLKLGLEGTREKEILHVIVDCCAQEKTYNPYYGYLAQALCQHHRRLMMGVQFALWDRIKELDTMQTSQRNNLALFTSHLLIKQALPLSSLKVIEYSELDKTRVKFLRRTLQKLLIDVEDDETCAAVFKRVTKGDKLNLLREGLKLFLRHFLMKRCSPNKKEQLERRIKIADDALRI